MNTLTDKGLLRRCLTGIHRGRRCAPRWAHVADTFAEGATSARALCRRFGLDPDEVVGDHKPGALDTCQECGADVAPNELEVVGVQPNLAEQVTFARLQREGKA